jgi:hypothetical protein
MLRPVSIGRCKCDHSSPQMLLKVILGLSELFPEFIRLIAGEI